MAWPTTDNPRTEFISVRLTADEATALEMYASANAISRSEALRDAVRLLTGGASKKAGKKGKR